MREYLWRAFFSDRYEKSTNSRSLVDYSLSLNCALVTWKTNRNISDKEPEKYLAARLEGTGIEKRDVAERLRSHLIPYDEMVAGDYKSFLQARATMIFDEMAKLCGKASSKATA